MDNIKYENQASNDQLVTDASYPAEYYNGPSNAYRYPSEHLNKDYGREKDEFHNRGRTKTSNHEKVTKDKVIKAQEHKVSDRLQDELASDHRKSKEKGLKEKTQIEFFERGMIRP